ncbi:MAG: ABC transporter ATP-binding protein [Actinomycetota bacterium]
MARITLVGVHAMRGEEPSLHGIDLDVEDGSTICVLGRSGSGKSTILRVVAGLTRPSEGRVLLDGVDITTVPTRERQVGLVMRENMLPSKLTPRRSIILPLFLRRREVDHQAEVEREANRFGVEELLDEGNATLSGGQRLLVQSARALVDPPRVLLLDEPFADLDPHRRLLLRQRLADRLASMTVILATSDPIEAMAIADTIAVLDRGQVRQFGTLAQLRDRPADVVVAELLGEPAMVMLPATVRERDVGTVLQVEGNETTTWNPRLASFDGLRLTTGWWPEDVSVPPRRGDLIVSAEVVQTEPLGATTLTHLRVPSGVRIRVAVPGPARPVGDILAVGLDPSRAHVFGPVDGEALAHPPARQRPDRA